MVNNNKISKIHQPITIPNQQTKPCRNLCKHKKFTNRYTIYPHTAHTQKYRKRENILINGTKLEYRCDVCLWSEWEREREREREKVDTNNSRSRSLAHCTGANCTLIPQWLMHQSSSSDRYNVVVCYTMYSPIVNVGWFVRNCIV